MPALLLALFAAAAFWEMQKRKAGSVPALPSYAPAAYTPPVNAPPAVIAAYTQALASNNPITLVMTAQQLQAQGYRDLAHALSLRYQTLTNNPIPGVAGVGGVGGRGLDLRTVRILHGMAQQRRRRVQAVNQVLAMRMRKTA
jgi:hypothetical protein